MGTNDSASAIESTLNRLESESFFTPTLAASGHNGVRSILLKTPELQFLIQHSAQAVPQMLQRLQRANGVKTDQTKIAYFVVFERVRDRRVLPELARYLYSLPDEQGTRVDSPWHPFRYAMDAAAALVPLPAHPASTAERFRRRHEIAAQLLTDRAHE